MSGLSSRLRHRAHVQAGRCLPLLALLCWLPTLHVNAETDRSWSVTPYVWATETQYKLKLDGSPVDEGTVTFDDLIDTTDASFQVVLEHMRAGGHLSFFADVTYLDTSDTYRGPLLRVDSDSEQWLIDTAVAWWPRGEASGFNLLAGARYADLDDSYEFSIADNGPRLGVVENARDFLDVMVGLRYRVALSQHWALLTRADYSTGDSDGIWQVQAVFRYGMGRDNQYGFMLGYRYKEATFKYRNLEEDNKYYGPLIGFNLRF